MIVDIVCEEGVLIHARNVATGEIIGRCFDVTRLDKYSKIIHMEFDDLGDSNGTR